eukprot:TRINITY_DN22385_c0_g1_i1.p1 TRINITY_DN22385_c0_g1~~TRINITY_DN22385_c0_g1_i1.p1  ORF type:complete len:261 (-),score=54.97 TRINITY_DN22385_c0_g1_i1:154-936(-)
MNAGRIAVVTGGNKGIGLAVCKRLAKLPDYRVILTSRDINRGHEALLILHNEGLKAEVEQLDVSCAANVADFGRRVLDRYGRVDVLINNAGISIDHGRSALDVPGDVVDKTFRTNTLGPLLLSQLFAPGMVANKYGRIVNVSSGLGQLSNMGGGFASYRLSKAALNALTRILDAELRGTNVLVNSACPGFVRTDMTAPRAPAGDPDARPNPAIARLFLRATNTKVVRSPDEGADTAVWLATLPDDGPRGGFFRDRQPIPW